MNQFPAIGFECRKIPIMKILIHRVVGGCLALCFGLITHAQSFTAGNLAVLRLGDGTQTLTNSGNSLFLDQYTTNGSLMTSATIPDAGTSALLLSGTAGSEGGMSRSLDRTVLTFIGYHTNRGAISGSLANQTGAAVPRGVGTIDAFGNYTLAQTSTTVYSANNARGAATDGTNNFWTAGTPNGAYYFNPPAAPVLVQTNVGGNTTGIKIINGNLYFATQKGTIGLYNFRGGGLPTTPTPTNILFATGSSSQPAGFDINSSLTTAYVADQRNSAGGIQKWVNNAGTWGLAYTFATGAGAFGVAVDFSGVAPIIYATTGEAVSNRLVCIVDTNSAATITLLATAGSNRWFRGLDFVPDLRPAIVASPQSQAVTNGAEVTFAVTAVSPFALGYQWQKNGAHIDGANDSSLILHSVTSADQGIYRVIVTNQYASATSADATLTVNSILIPPSITMEPQSQTNPVSGSATFTVAASGSETLNYQWQFNNGDLTNQTNSSLLLTCVSPANQGNYHVRVFNGAGSTNSHIATLTVVVPAPSWVAYPNPGMVYTQAFDSLPNPGANSVNANNPVMLDHVTYALANPLDFAFPVTSCATVPGGVGLADTLAGWYGLGSGAAQLGASAGDQSTGGIISFGLTNSAAASTNRALGLLATSSSGSTAFGVRFINQSTNTLTQMNLHFTGELWRQSAVAKTLAVGYCIDPTATGSFSTNLTAALAGLDVNFPANPAATNPIPVDGTAAFNQVSLGISNLPITNWPPGAALWLVWQMTDAAGKGQGLAIDDLTFSASMPPIVVAASLAIQSFGANLFLTWPADAAGYVLQNNADLTQSNGWSTVGEPVVPTNGLNTVTIPMPVGTEFYRLKR